MADTTTPDSAKAVIQALMDQVGLGSLGEWAWQQYQAGVSAQDIVLLARQTDAYKARYPAMDALNKAGRGITEGEYQAYERTVHQMSRAYGLPAGMYDTPQGIAELLVKDVSASEVSDRIKIAAASAYTAPPEVRDALVKQYGVRPGDLIGFWLDPDKAMPLLERTWNAAQIMGAGKQEGITVDKQMAEALGDRGVNFEQAREGLGNVAKAGSLSQGQGETISQRDLINAQFGDAKAQQKAERVAGTRTAAFGGSGGVVAGQGGVSGLGSASSN